MLTPAFAKTSIRLSISRVIPAAFILPLIVCTQLFSQSFPEKDSLPEKKITPAADTALNRKHSPRKAMIMSALLPGLGQAYNKKYWKIPVIYAGFATLGYFIHTNAREYRKFKDAYIYVLNKDSSYTDNEYVTKYPIESLKTGKDYYRRNLEVTYMLTGLLYILNVVDAVVDANLYDYDISDELSLHIEPMLDASWLSNNQVTGIKMTLKF